MSKELDRNEILVGNSKEKLKELPRDSVDLVMTSPPYWGLRDYGHEDQLGLEETPEEFVENLMKIFDEIKRVLKPSGTFFLNIDDTYGRSSSSDKCMAMVPEKVMMAMVNAGWILRNKVIWRKKGGGMPESVSDRFSTTWEYVYMFSLNKDYYFDLDAIREPYKESSKKRAEYGFSKRKAPGQTEESNGGLTNKGKNPGDMWTVATANMSEAHFAVYPEELCEKPIKAGCPKKVCAECGEPYERGKKKVGEKEIPPINTQGDKERMNRDYKTHKNIFELKGLEKSCECDSEEWCRGVVLDPFAGAGTTCLSARKLGRDYVGIELNEEYAELARDRISEEAGSKRLSEFF